MLENESAGHYPQFKLYGLCKLLILLSRARTKRGWVDIHGGQLAH